MKRSPKIYTVEDVENFLEVNTDLCCIFNYSTGKTRWVPYRPLHTSTIRNKLSLAWKVFSGEYDVLYWPGQEK